MRTRGVRGVSETEPGGRHPRRRREHLRPRPGGPTPSRPPRCPANSATGSCSARVRCSGCSASRVFRAQPLPTRVSVPVAQTPTSRSASTTVPKQTAYSIIDSGGVYGTLPAYLIGGAFSVPSNTKDLGVHRRRSDAAVLLQHHPGANSPTVVGDGELMNTGYIPFQQVGLCQPMHGAEPDRVDGLRHLVIRTGVCQGRDLPVVARWQVVSVW